jgi:hypothetical protein
MDYPASLARAVDHLMSWQQLEAVTEWEKVQ